MKRSILMAMVVSSLLNGAAHAQMVVNDPANQLNNTIMHGESIAQMANQLTQLKQQYEVLQQQYQSVTGSYGRGQIGLNDSLSAARVVPGSWQDVVNQQ